LLTASQKLTESKHGIVFGSCREDLISEGRCVELLIEATYQSSIEFGLIDEDGLCEDRDETIEYASCPKAK
jgi:hypothetical protein